MRKLLIIMLLLLGGSFTSCQEKTDPAVPCDTIDTIVDSLDSVLLEEYNSLPSDEYLEDSDYCC